MGSRWLIPRDSHIPSVSPEAQFTITLLAKQISFSLSDATCEALWALPELSNSQELHPSPAALVLTPTFRLLVKLFVLEDGRITEGLVFHHSNYPAP